MRDEQDGTRALVVKANAGSKALTSDCDRRDCSLSAHGREVGVRAAMLVAPPEQVSHN